MPETVEELTIESFQDPRVFINVVEKGLPAIPALIEKMKDAPGDIEWVPRRGEKTISLRYPIQSSIVSILEKEYSKRHPGYISGIPSSDYSLQLLRWWEKERVWDDDFNLPDIMPIWAVRHAETLELVNSNKLFEARDRARKEKAAFKQRGYRTINEMLAETGSLENAKLLQDDVDEE